MVSSKLKIASYFIAAWLFSGSFVSPSYANQSQSDVPISAAQQKICKAKNFDDFFDSFTENIEMQKLCTHFPLQKLELVEEQDDLIPKLVKLSDEQIIYPLILTKEHQKEQQLRLKILTINNKIAKVTLYKPDTGYQVIYRFKKKKIWKLIKIEDWSV